MSLDRDKDIRKKLKKIFPVGVMKFEVKDNWDGWDDVREMLINPGPMETEPTILEGPGKTSLLEEWQSRCYLLNEFQELSDLARSCVNQYVWLHQMDELQLWDSWYTVMHKGSKIQRHRHECSVVSGTICLSEGEHMLAFTNPTIPYRMYERPYHSNELNSYVHVETMTKGDILVYPSWLEHFVPQIDTDNRVTISFNTDYPRQLR